MTILPKGQLANVDDNESRMLSAESKKNAYYFDYTIKAENQPKVNTRLNAFATYCDKML